MQTLNQQSCYAPRVGIFANDWTMDGLESDTALIKDLCQWSGMAPSKVASQAGLAATTILRPYNGQATTRISGPTFDKLRAAFPTFPRWANDGADLDDSHDADPAMYVPIRLLPTYAGMGGGGTGKGAVSSALVSRQLVEHEFRGRADDFLLIDCRGDSMTPLFEHGDRLLIDTRDRDPIQPGPFAILDGDAYVVKLVERAPGKRGWYRVFSANDRYSAEEIEETETTILGRPVWFARRL